MPNKKEITILGILNVTPDSFYDGGFNESLYRAINVAGAYADKGADYIDIGGESTRPGANKVDVETEIKRVIPLLKELVKEVPCKYSVDTYKSEVAKQAIDNGASIINDVSAGTFDSKMIPLVAGSNVDMVFMHMDGEPKTMQEDPKYSNVVKEVGEYLLERASLAEKSGIKAEKIILDPGIGFGKRQEDNLNLIKYFSKYIDGRYRVLIGHSRKSFIGNLLENKPAEYRLMGSIGAACAAVNFGADMLRVHDITETIDSIKVFSAIEGI